MRFEGVRCSLPTAFQFRLVAGAGKGWPYGFQGPEVDARYYGNFFGYRDGYRGLAPVKEYLANEWGIYGLMGNASEWVRDSPLSSESTSLVHPEDFRLRLGGSYRNSLVNCRSSHSQPQSAGQPEVQIGFRIVCAPLPRPQP
jgi:formylglycine-generating enzyme required for sulfatase activity